MSEHTYGTQFEAAMACETKEQAERWLVTEIGFYKTEYGKAPEVARKTIMHNLGYMAGYHDHETAQKIFKLFGAVHPIFGSSTYHKDVSAEAAFRLGLGFLGRDG